MYSKTKTCVLNGLNGYDIDVEADLSSGLQAFNIVGLPISKLNRKLLEIL